MAKKVTSKKTRKINFARKNKRPLIVLVAALFVATGIAAAMQAYAYPDSVRICYSNDSTSIHYIELNRTDSGWRTLLYRGGCASIWNKDGQARVYLPYRSGLDVSAENIKSYRKKADGGSYGPCYATGTNSNPFNVGRVYYKVYKRANCAT
jgi:hypothetical protein